MLSLLKNAHVRTFFSFSAIQGMQMVLPLLAFPWLGRVLGPDAFGLLMYMCLVPPIICLIMEWGITLGGARMAAAIRGDVAALGRLFGDVFSAKLILAGLCLAGGCLALPYVPHASAWPCAYFMAIGLGIARGMSPLWFYQGAGKGMKELAVWDVLASLTALILIFVCIHAPESWPAYLLIMTACKLAIYLTLSIFLWRRLDASLNFPAGLKILTDTKTLFASSFFMMIYTNGAQLLIGCFLPAAQMGVIVAINKMLRALGSLINPFTQTIFPEVCILARLKSARARTILVCSLFCTMTAMLVGAIFVILLAPWVIGLALGPEYTGYAPILKIMICSAPFLGANYVLGTQTLVAFGKEKAQVTVQAIVAAMSLPLAAALTVRGNMDGAAWLPVCVEGAIFCGYITAIKHCCPGALFAKNIAGK